MSNHEQSTCCTGNSKRLDDVKAGHTSAAAAVKQAEAEGETLARRIESADPDGAELPQLATLEVLAAARLKAYRAREAEARQAVAAAERAADEDQRRQRQEEIRRLDAEAREIGADLDRIAVEAQARIAERAAELTAKVARANKLDGRAGHHRGISWAVTIPGSELAHAQSRIMFLRGAPARFCPVCGTRSLADDGRSFACVICDFRCAAVESARDE